MGEEQDIPRKLEYESLLSMMHSVTLRSWRNNLFITKG